MILLRSMTGLRARLVAAIGVTVIVTLAVAFAVVYRQTGAELTQQLDMTVKNSAGQLADAIRQDPDATPEQALAAARRFARSQPYARAAVVLYAIVPGHGTASNHPELFGLDHTDDDETGGEQAQENLQGRRLEQPRPGFADQIAPDTGVLRTYEEPVSLADGTTVYAGAGQPVDSIARAQHGVRASYLLAGSLGLLIALIGAFAAGTRMAAPLRRAAATAAEVDGGDLSPRFSAPPSASQEVQVLGTAFNHMLDRLTDAFDSQREFVADASHELRTPLTVIRGQIDLLSASDLASGEDLERITRIIRGEIARMSRLTDDLLLLAQSEQADFLHRERVPLAQFIEDLWDGLSLTAERRFQVGPLPQATICVDPDRLAQALRNLGTNAIQHTREGDGLVRIDATIGAHGSGGGATVRFVVSDDGPGIPQSQRARIFERFYRTDQARARVAGGAGLGLAIVAAIAQAHGGSVEATPRHAGGTLMVVDLPTEPL